MEDYEFEMWKEHPIRIRINEKNELMKEITCCVLMKTKIKEKDVIDLNEVGLILEWNWEVEAWKCNLFIVWNEKRL